MTIQDDVDRLIGSAASQALRERVANTLQTLDEGQREVVRQALDEAMDLEDRTVRDVRGRDGKRIPVHHYRACRAEDAEASWSYRAPSAPLRTLRDALMAGLLSGEGVRVEGAHHLADAAASGKRLLFIGNHESVFDLAVLPYALRAAALSALSERLTFFVNPKIFNMPFVNVFICKPVGLIKVPQNPRIAANESVMDPEEIRRRAHDGFQIGRERLAAGDSLVIYPEGLRSEGLLHRFARAYLDLLRPSDDVLLAPWAHRGVRGLEDLSTASPEVTVRFGEPVEPGRFFRTVGDHPRGVAGHLAAFLVARLLPESQRGLYGEKPEVFLDHPHPRQGIRAHTLADIRVARELAETL